MSQQTREQWHHTAHDKTIAGPTYLVRGQSRAIAEVYAQQDAEKYARLIAAAPDGLEFAQSFIAWVDQIRATTKRKELLPGLDAREREALAFIAKAIQS